MVWAAWVTVLYGIVLLWTSVAGQDLEHPPFSLFWGLSSSLLVIASGIAVFIGYAIAKTLGLTIVGIVTLILCIRFFRTRVFVPTGVLAILGLLVAQLLLTA